MAGPVARDVTNSIYPNQYSLTTGSAQLISGVTYADGTVQGRRGRTLYVQASAGTILLGDENVATSGIGIEITGSTVFNDYTSAPWYAVGVGGNATANVIEIY